MSKGSDSISSSTRTFRTAPPKEPARPPRRPIKLPKLPKPKVRRLSPWIAVAALLIFSVFMYVQYHEAKQKLQTSDVAKTNQQMLDKLQKFIELPASEKPTFATVENVTLLKKQSSFFDAAKNGDKLIVYSKAKKTLLYRPSTNTIVNFSTSLKITTNNASGQ